MLSFSSSNQSLLHHIVLSFHSILPQHIYLPSLPPIIATVDRWISITAQTPQPEHDITIHERKQQSPTRREKKKKPVIILDPVRSGPQIDLHSPLPPFLDDSSVYNAGGIPTVHMAEYNNAVEEYGISYIAGPTGTDNRCAGEEE